MGKRRVAVSAPAASLLRLLFETGFREGQNRWDFTKELVSRLDVLIVELLRAGRAVEDEKGIHFGSPKGMQPRYSDDFEAFWRAYPRKREKQATWYTWCLRLHEGLDVPPLIVAAGNYAAAMKAEGRMEQYMLHPKSFLNKERWRDYEMGPGGAPPEKFKELGG